MKNLPSVLNSVFRLKNLPLYIAMACAVTNPRAGHAQEMETVVVKGRAALEGSTASVLSIQKESTTVTEVSGAEEFLRMGDSNAAETLERVTGLTVEDNKFVVIRGQPKRYTSTLFNGSQLPSLDPIQQITPLDLFPSGVLSSISVQKAYTADRAGSFGSGQVQLSTSGLPLQDFLEFKLGSGMNGTTDEDAMQFATGTGFLGGVDEILKLPADVAEVQNAGTLIASLPQAQQNDLARSFSDALSPTDYSIDPDASFSVAAGKRFDGSSATYGASLNFDYDRKGRVEQEENRQLRLGSREEVEVQDEYDTNRTRLNTSLGGLLALTGEWEGHRLKSNTFWVRDATEKTMVDEGLFQTSNTEWLRRFTLEYEQRELLMQQFTGHHEYEPVEFDWRMLMSDATRKLPDRREYQLENTQINGSGTFFLDPGGVNLVRNFSEVDEETFSAGGDLTLPLSFMSSDNLVTGFKTGADYEFRDRTSEIRQFGFATTGSLFRPIEQVFADQNIGVNVNFTEFGGVANDYLSEVEIMGGYGQLDFEMPERFRLVAGLRYEDASFQVRTFESGGAAAARPIDSGFDEGKALPSLVGSWFLSEQSQVRAGLTRSVSYPATVEVSSTVFIDTEADEQFLGNPLLNPAVIDSADLRWEWYPEASEAFTVGLFYKDFKDPIERRFTPLAGGSEIISFVNADKGKVAGVELNSYFSLARLRQWMSGGPEWLDMMDIGGNFAWQDSEVEITTVDASTNPVRRMTGQPDTLLNLQLGYTGDEHVIRLKFGRVGQRLITAGIEGLPDEYLEPRMDIGLKWSWSPLSQPALEPLTVSLELENLLNDAYERTQGAFVTRTYKTGVTASLSLKWRLD